jgi:hypothetical protein
VQRLAAAARRSRISLVQLINRHDTVSGSVKDYEFSRATVEHLWSCGRADAGRCTAHADWAQVTAGTEGLRSFDLTR